METIIAGLISAASAIIVCLINNNRLVSLIEYRLDQLEKKQDLHNNAVSRLYEVERKLGIDEEKINENKRELPRLGEFHTRRKSR